MNLLNILAICDEVYARAIQERLEVGEEYNEAAAYTLGLRDAALEIEEKIKHKGDFKMENQQLRGLQKVRVPKEFLVKKLTENREVHKQIFEEALEGWHQEVLKMLAVQMERAKADKRYNPEWYLPMPQDHTREYDKALALLEASLDEEFELTIAEFTCYIQDDWGWKADFINTASNYRNK